MTNQRSEVSLLIRKAHKAKQQGDYSTIKLIQHQITLLVELQKQRG